MVVKALAIAVLLLTAVGMTAANAADYLDDAKRLVAAGDFKTARIQLKNALRAEPANMEAHYRLASVQLELGDAAGAEKEARIARDGGYDPDQVVPLLARAYLAAGKYRDILRDFTTDEGSGQRRAQLALARGHAQQALGAVPDARRSYAEAGQLDPQSPEPLLAEAKLALQARDAPAADELINRAQELAPQSPALALTKAELLRQKGEAQAAVALLDKAIEGNASQPALRLARAELQLALGKDEQAQSDVTAARVEQPGSIAATYLQVMLDAKAKKFREANSELEKIASALAVLPRGYYIAAFVKYNLHELRQAEDFAQRFVARFPDDVPAQKLLSGIEIELGRADAAVKALSRIEQAGAADPQTFDLLGRGYTQLGRMDEAVKAFEQAIKGAPDDASLRFRFGVAQLQLGNQEEAIKDFTRSLDLTPSGPAGAALVFIETAAGRYDVAMTAVETLAKAQPDSPVPGTLEGMIKFAQLDLDGARQTFAAVLAKQPDFIPARINLARVAELQGRPDEARQLLESVLKQQPGHADALSRLVGLLLRNGQNGEAILASERAHTAAPDNAGITIGLIDLCRRLGDNNRALAVARSESGSNDLRNAPLIAARARAEFSAGLATEAAQSYRRLIDIDKSAIEPRRQLAAVLLSTGDAAAAREALDEALKLAPAHTQLIEDRIGIDLKSEGIDAAMATARRLAAQLPNPTTGAALEGDVYEAAGRLDDAAAAYAKAYQESPSSLRAIRYFQLTAATGKAEDGARLLREWYAAHPEDLVAAAVLGAADIRARRLDEARRELEAVIEKAPRDAVSLNNLAWLYLQIGDPGARVLAQRAYMLAPDIGQIAGTLGWILTKQGGAAAAIGLLRQASAAAPANTEIKYHLAVALSDSGRHDEAKKILASLISAGGEFDDKPAATKLLTSLGQP